MQGKVAIVPTFSAVLTMVARLASSSARSAALSAMSIGRNFSTTPVARLATAASGSAAHKGPWADRPASTGLNRYMIVAEDYSDAEANARRLEVRERHLEQARNGKQVGRIELGGALLKKDFDQIDEEVGPGPILGGSVLIVLGEVSCNVSCSALVSHTDSHISRASKMFATA